MTTPERSVDEIVDEFEEIGEPTEAQIRWLTKTLQTERQKRDAVVEAERKRVSDTLDAIAFQTMHEKRYSENMENGLLAHKERCMCKTCIEATRHAEMAAIEQISEALT